MYEFLTYALTIPFMTGLFSIWIRQTFVVACINLLSAAVTAGCLYELVRQTAANGMFRQGIFLVDELSAVFIIIVGVLTVTSMLFSFFYMRQELDLGHISAKMIPRYYAMLQFFIFTMIFTLVVENLGLLWVAIEAITLISALLVAYYLNRSSIEAAWKYVMVCSVGIAMALLGTMLLYCAQAQVGTIDSQPLSWIEMRTDGARFDRDWSGWLSFLL